LLLFWMKATPIDLETQEYLAFAVTVSTRNLGPE
jgi:hypothetical protein